ncbi:hypothetical protein CAPTEDRAFT_168481 [Capitella teleta]|uniref:Uncharacterized protein n=1 Tax=Capitella teleta TaxID=283909 RepID=R7UT78_CAPTE|nr:hypothetical protein CAPTEDRAFT_168481 [Capitella teleta]|eukprot:ELU07112.1 hypothetical protein CAPTEDRAFT_168481 [Capitella teleta]
MSSASLGNRLDVLAQPKQAPLFVPHRRSVYWPEKQPPKIGSTTAFAVNPWQDNLAKPKNVHPGWTLSHRWEFITSHYCHYPIWPVSNAAKKAEATPRLQQLAESKSFHPNHNFDRSVFTDISKSAQNARCSGRLEALAQQKPHLVWQGDKNVTLHAPVGEFNDTITKVSATATKAGASERLAVLSEHKNPPPKYKPERSVLWPVTHNAKNAVATTRLQQLSRPKSARLTQYDFDNWYKVNPSALSAHCTNRLATLAEPIPRKVRQKKA